MLKHFDEFDTNKDGALDPKELETARAAKHHGKGPGIGKMAQMDTNTDGKITAAEASDAIVRIFSRLDADNDGAITQAELKAMRRGPHSR